MRTSISTVTPTWSAGSELPALASLLSSVPPDSGVQSVLITHVLRTAVAYIEAVHSVFPVASVVAIPYSANTDAVAMLKAKGLKVVVPPSVAATFAVAEEEVLAALAKSDAPLLVQEVGGYLAHCSARLAAYPQFLGVVEDTNNGHWLYERTGPHPVPVLSMAQSPLKAIEDSVIGDAAIYSVERILREEFSLICQGLRCGILGYGKIGRSTADALKGRETVVSVYDIDPAKNMRAKMEAFFPRPLHGLLADSELVVGCTGQKSIRLVDMPFLKDEAILASASSKDVEFALSDFAKHCQVEKLSNVVWRYRQPNKKCFYILAEGTPVNFRDGSIIGTLLDMIYCELLVCMREVSLKRAPIGLTKSAAAIQDEVAKAWLSVHSVEFFQALDDKTWTYPDSLKLGLPEPQ